MKAHAEQYSADKTFVVLPLLNLLSHKTKKSFFSVEYTISVFLAV